MRILIAIILIVVSSIARAASPVAVQAYTSNGQLAGPTNFISSNILAGANTTVTPNANGSVTIASSGGAGIAGTIINTGASTTSKVPGYTDTTGTNVAPRTVTGTGNILATSTIGSTVEAWDADLDAIAALTGTGILKRTGVATFSLATSAADLSNGTSGSGAVILAAGPTISALTTTGNQNNSGKMIETVRDIPTSTWDTSLGHDFTKTISASTTLTVTGLAVGERAMLTATNTNPSSYYLLFSGVDSWINGIAPNQTQSIGVYQLWNDDGVVRGLFTEAPHYAGGGSLLVSSNTTSIAELPLTGIADGYQLTADAASALKMKWAAPVSTAGFLATSSGSGTNETFATTTTFKGSGGETVGLFQDDGLYVSSTTAAGATKRVRLRPNASTIDIDVQNGGGNTDINLFSGGRSGLWKGSSSFSPGTTGVNSLGTASLGWLGFFIDGATQTGSVPYWTAVQTWNNSGVTFVGGIDTITDTASAAASVIRKFVVGSTTVASVRKDGSLFSAALTTSRALASDSSGFISSTAVTSTELGYVSGVTSAIQTQFTAKAPSASPTFSGTVTTPVTASRALVTGASSELAAATTTATEIGYVNGVTSAIQTQINTKAPAASPTFSGTITTPLTSSRALTTGSGSELAVSATTATELGYVNGVTSAIQTQLGTKLTDPMTTRGDIIVRGAINPSRLQLPTYGQGYYSDGTDLFGVNPKTVIRMETEFVSIADSIDTMFNLANVISSGTIGSGASTVNHPGLADIGSGVLGGASLLSYADVFFGGGLTTVSFIFKTPSALSDGTTTYVIRVGFGDSNSSADVTDGAYLEYDQTQSVNWRYCSSNNSTRTKTNSSTVVAADTWYNARVIVNSSGTQADYYLNDTLLGSQTTNISTSRATNLMFYFYKSVGATVRTASVDWSGWLLVATSSRY